MFVMEVGGKCACGQEAILRRLSMEYEHEKLCAHCAQSEFMASRAPEPEVSWPVPQPWCSECVDCAA